MIVPTVLKLILRKAVQLVVILAAVSAATFWLLDSAGGDALAGLSENPNISAETMRRLRTIYGLDRPLAERYFVWAGGAVTGDLGDSLSLRLPVGTLLISRVGETLEIAALTLVISLSFSLAFTFVSVRIGHWLLNAIVEACILLSASVPVIVSSLVILAFAATSFNLRVSGSALLPALALAPPFIALFLAQANRGLRSALQQEFILTARAKGLGETAVILRHAGRIALNPIITLTGLSVGSLIGGSVIAETVFGRQGIGSLSVTAVRTRDVPLVMGIVVFVTIAVWLANFAAEIGQVINDRRMTEDERS